MGLFNKKTEDEKSTDASQGQSMKDLYDNKGAKKVKAVKSVIKEDDSKKVEKSSSVAKGNKTHGDAYRILVKPLLTEKISNLGELNKYSFKVSLKANKIEISKAIRELYGVSAKKINIIRMKGKRVKYGKVAGKRKDWKKAIVTLPKNESINIYEGI